MSVRVSIAGRAEADLTHQYRWYLDNAGAGVAERFGLPPSTLHRLERGDQSITLRGLRQIMRRLKCRLGDIFPTE